MMWGGLRLIQSRLCLDLITLIALGYAIYSHSHLVVILLLSSASVITFLTSGLTKRWTISFPLIPIITIQTIRLLCLKESQTHSQFQGSDNNNLNWAQLLIGIVSTLLILLSTALSILFPAVEISPPNGKYNVGVIDLHLPVKFDGEKSKLHPFDLIPRGNTNTVDGFVSARLLYPTLDPVYSLPHLNKETAKKVCKSFVVNASPCKSLSWILDNWQLSTIQAKRNAQPIQRNFSEENDEVKNCDKFPVVVFSHGLIGNVDIYSYQCMNLASNGSIVISVNHTDGSSIGMTTKDGSFLPYDPSLLPLYVEDRVKYVRERRNQTDHRSSELLAATTALLQLNKRNIPELDEIGISFVDKIDIFKVAVAGHSFGGATALTTATRYPSLYSCVIAHDPMCDWMTDDTRKIMFEKKRFQGSYLEYHGGTGGYEADCASNNNNRKVMDENASIHDLDMLFLYSHEWKKDGSGHYPYVSDMFRRGQIGPRNNNRSECAFIQHAHHPEFCDLDMMIPLWLGRATGTIGKRNPHETAEEIAERTSDFMKEVLNKKAIEQKQKNISKQQ